MFRLTVIASLSYNDSVNFNTFSDLVFVDLLVYFDPKILIILEIFQ